MKHYRLLRMLLFASSLTWLISIFGILLPWPTIEPVLTELGATEIKYDKMIEYWFRMTSGAFTGIGCLFLYLSLSPIKLKPLIPFAGFFMVGEGLVLVFHGLNLGLGKLPFLADATACLVLGTGILLLNAKLNWDALYPTQSASC